MKKVLIIFGTRPEAIKMAPLILKLKDCFDTKVCVTAQHREMLDQALDLFGIIPDFDLNIMRPGQDLFEISARVLGDLKTILEDQEPDMVLVHGDTSTSVIAALSAFYKKIPVGHVEAGLRTYDRYSPFPEEINRQLTSRLASFHFAPTESAKNNLINEGIPEESIFITGNTVVDSLLSIKEKAKGVAFSKDILSKLSFLLYSKDETLPEIILVTGHRRENFGKGFEEVCLGIKDIALAFPKVQIVYPVHLNPNVLEPTNRILSQLENVYLIDPLEYLQFIKLMNISKIILTDSGGIQEEAPSFGKPVLLMRETTERPEAIETGFVKLVGPNRKEIYQNTKDLLIDSVKYNSMANSSNPFGDGKASERIKEILVSKLK